MHFTTVISMLVTGFLAVSSALPTTGTEPALEKRGGQCRDPIIRKEWRTLNNLEKANYLLAVKCMMHKQPTLSIYATGITTRWEDFIWTHQRVMPKIHYVGQFLPWHRLFLYEYERALREECLYFGGVPYWDQSKDYQDILASPVLNGELSFGGNGAYDANATQSRLPDMPVFNYTGGGCIKNGVFKDEVIHLGNNNDSSYHERCIKRNIIREPAQLWQKPSRVADVLAKPNFEEFAVSLEGNLDWTGDFGIHNSGHLTIEGDMIDTWISPSDPLFYVFHANIDRIWWKWQQQNPPANLFAVGNPISPRLPLFATMWSDAPAGNVTLDFKLDLGPLAGERLTVKTAQVLDTRGSTPEGYAEGVNCYTYQ